MKALFDPLVLKKVSWATPAEIFAHGRALDEIKKRRAALEASIGSLIDPYKKKLYEGRVAMLPPDVRAVVRNPRKTARSRSKDRRRLFPGPAYRSADKIKEIMPAAERQRYQELQDRLNQVEQEAVRAAYPAFWTVEVDPRKELEKSYILTSGDPDRPEKNHEVTPGLAVRPPGIDFREGRIEAFADWLTAPENPCSPAWPSIACGVALRRRIAEDPQRFRQSGRRAGQSAVARLARRRIRERANSA